MHCRPTRSGGEPAAGWLREAGTVKPHLLFVTGKLAEASLRRELQAMEPVDFTWDVAKLGISVAGLMTTDFVARHLPRPVRADRVVLPGRCRGDVAELAANLGVPAERGPDELKDLPRHFGRDAKRADLSRHDLLIFAEIVDAPQLAIDALLARARANRADGADVVDLGCLPGTRFPHLEEAVQALRAEGFRVSVDSLQREELLRGGRAGADYLLSLDENSLDIADEVASTPVLIPARHGDLESLARAVEAMRGRGRPFLADAILDPIHFGFTRSLARFQALRDRMPDAPIMIGTGNVTELTDADTSGMTAVLLGAASELRASAILTTQVSPHCRRAIREADWARRMMHAAREDSALPRGYTDALLTVHARRPFPYSAEEISALAAEVRDPNFRIQVSAEGIHVYNRDGLHRATDPFDLYPSLGVEDDGGHAFYLGVEIGRAQVAWRLGRRYAQDEDLDFGCADERPEADLRQHRAPGTTMRKRRRASEQ